SACGMRRGGCALYTPCEVGQYGRGFVNGADFDNLLVDDDAEGAVIVAGGGVHEREGRVIGCDTLCQLQPTEVECFEPCHDFTSPHGVFDPYRIRHFDGLPPGVMESSQSLVRDAAQSRETTDCLVSRFGGGSQLPQGLGI